MEIHAWYSKMSNSRLPLNAGFLVAVDGRGANVLAVCLIPFSRSLAMSFAAVLFVALSSAWWRHFCSAIGQLESGVAAATRVSSHSQPARQGRRYAQGG